MNKILLILLISTQIQAQIFLGNSGNISFFSETPIENITAVNDNVSAVFDASNNDLVFQLNISDFIFPNALMQEHFNENYMMSTKYPKATFNGTIDNISGVNFEKAGTYTSPITGKLTIKDVTKTVTTTATFKVSSVVNGKAVFKLNPEDYNIKIPNVVSKKISREIKITVDVDYKHKH